MASAEKENTMKYGKLGRSNLTVSKICLGTMHFGPYASETESFAIMDRALELGINFFDTANVYGGPSDRGRSEIIVGNWLAQHPENRDRVVLATKVFGPMTDATLPNEERGISAYRVRKHLAASLKRLRTDHIDLYQVHHFDRGVSGEEFWGTFERTVADGDVLYIGSSNFPGWGLAKFQSLAWHRGFLGLVSEQTQYNLLNRIPELEVLPAAKDCGIGIMAYMPLAGGLLTGKAASAEGSRTRALESEYGMRVGAENTQLKDFTALCRDLGETEAIVATAWTLQHPAVSTAIVGIHTAAQLDGVVRAAELELNADAMSRLETIFSINRGRPLRTGAAPEAYSW
jgi:aryl-alcohol dehydrogenase-like predicted oxidoreductase